MRTCRFTKSDADACDFGCNVLRWDDYVKRILSQLGWDLNQKTTKTIYCDSVVYCQEV